MNLSGGIVRVCDGEHTIVFLPGEWPGLPPTECPACWLQRQLDEALRQQERLKALVK